MKAIPTQDLPEHFEAILTPEALEFLATLHQQFESRRQELLQHRVERRAEIKEGRLLHFLKETEEIRNDESWKVAATPDDLQQRWVEITGPTERKMMINALNSGADVFMADCEDANTPSWSNVIEGQINLRDAVNETISLETDEGKSYTLNKEHAVLMVRPRGWHLDEKHLTVGGSPMSGSLVDFGLYLYHNAHKLIEKGTGPYFYLAKLESHHEARLWNDVFIFAQEQLGVRRGTIRATVLIETILAAFEMEEILFELREHSAGLNAGRWDYIFSVIKVFHHDNELHLPDRDQITMTVSFMRAYTELLVHTCHKRGAHAMGGMAAFIPNRKEPDVTERALRKVREDKEREAKDGFDGTWVAHPDLVPVAREIFEKRLNGKPNQKERLRNDVDVTANDLVNFAIEGGTITEAGVRHNLNVALQYIASWLAGRGAAAIDNLMEDAATAEISRAQVWQWIHNHERESNGTEITEQWVEKLLDEEIRHIQKQYGEYYDQELFAQAQEILEELLFSNEFAPFLTIPAYHKLT